jgi:hypothetical protein
MNKTAMFSMIYKFLLMAVAGCGATQSTDPAANSALQEKTDSTTTVAHALPTVPFAGPTCSAVTNTSLTLSWTASIDTSTAGSQLTYLAFYTTEMPDEFTLTVDEVNANWTAVGTQTTGSTSVEVADLTPKTTYYFTVRVSDADGNASIYPITTQVTSPNSLSDTTTTSTTTTNSVGPTVTIGEPSSTLVSSTGTVTIPFTYVPSVAGVTSLTGVVTAMGGGITITPVIGTPVCTVAVNPLTSAGGSIVLSACTGSGTFTVHVDGGSAEDPLGNLSAVSTESAVITIDNVAPTLISLTPATGLVNPTPTSVVASFSKSMAPLSSADFTVGGTCTTLPTKGAVQMSADGKVATLSLSGGTCTHTQVLTVLLNPSTTTDTLGNICSGTSVTRVYTVSTTGPSASLGTPSHVLLNVSTTATIALTYAASPTGGTVSSGTLTPTGGGITVTTVSGSPSCVVSVSSIAATGATITLSSCTGSGSLTVHANAGTAKDASGNNSTVSGESSTITIDNTPPTLVSVTPATGTTIYTIPSTIGLNFSESVNAVAGDFSLSSSTCSSNPSISSISGSGSSAVTLSISGGTCTSTETLVLISALTGITDTIGNAGSGTNTVTLTFGPIKRIFLTSSTHNGNFGGISGVDSFCSSDANKPSTGTYHGMITNGSTRVACTSAFCATGGASEHVDWALAANTFYTRADGTPIGMTTSNGVFTFPLTNSFGTVGFPGGRAWTGMDFSNKTWIYRNACTCSGWTSASSGVSGCYGSGASSDTDDNSISYYSDTCDKLLRVYCVEQ